MKRISYILLLLAFTFCVYSQTPKRADYTSTINAASKADTYQRKQEALALMQKFHSTFGNYSYDCKHLGGAPFYWKWMENYAELNYYFGNYATAEQAYNDIINSIENNKCSTSRTARLNRLRTWLRQGKYTEVINMITRQKCLLPDGDESVLLAQFILAEARYNRNLDDGSGKDDCFMAYEILDSIAREHGVDKDSIYFKALNAIGMMYSGFGGEYISAACKFLTTGLEYYESAGADNLNGQQLLDYYTIMSNLAYAEGRQRKFDLAIRHIDKALAWQLENLAKNDNHYITSLWKKANILFMKAEYSGAQKDIDNAVNAFKSYFELQKDFILQHFACMTEHERSSFWAAQYEPLTACYLVGEYDPKFAYQVALFVKNIQLLTSFDIRNLAKDNTKLSALVEKYDNLRNNKLKQATIEAQILKTIGSNKLYQAFQNSMNIQTTAICKQLRTKDVAIEWIETEVNGDSTYVALVLHKNGNVKFIPTFNKKAFFSRRVYNGVSSCRLTYALTSKESGYKEYIYNDRNIGNELWQDVMDGISEKSKVYFSPTGLFNILAIEYLQFDKKDCQFYRLSSTGELGKDRIKSSKSDRALIVGGIDYNNFDEDIKPVYYPDRTGYNMLSTKYVFGPNSLFATLKGASREVDSIRNNIFSNSLNVDLVKGRKATERLMKDTMKDYSLVHLSTHGYSMDFGSTKLLQRDSLMQDQLMVRTGLAFAGANVAGYQNKTVEDGILTAKEISELNLSKVKLVSLSACQTAIAKMTDEEVASISRAFKKAGAGAMIVSLWSTDDDGSQVFFCKFFEYLKDDIKKHSIRDAFYKAREYLKTAGEVKIRCSTSGFSTSKMAGNKGDTYVKTVDFSRPKYYDSYILIDAID